MSLVTLMPIQEVLYKTINLRLFDKPFANLEDDIAYFKIKGGSYRLW